MGCQVVPIASDPRLISSPRSSPNIKSTIKHYAIHRNQNKHQKFEMGTKVIISKSDLAALFWSRLGIADYSSPPVTLVLTW